MKSKTRGGVDYGLNSLKTTPDKQMRKSVEKLKVQERRFNNIQLKGLVKGVEWYSDSHVKTLINNAARNLKITANYADKF